MNFGGFTPTEAWIYGTLMYISRYLLIAGLAYMIFYRIGKKHFSKFKIQQYFPSGSAILTAIGYSLMTFIIYGSGIWILKYWSEEGMTRGYNTIEEYGIPYFIVSIILMILLHDTYFYWTHRLIHHPGIYPYFHKVHHQFHNPTPWAAFAFHPLESILSMGIIPLIIFVIPYHPAALIVFITFMVAYTVFIHLGYAVPGIWLSNIRNDSSDHDYHHHKGHGNYGLYFNIWDKAMGTYCRRKSNKSAVYTTNESLTQQRASSPD